ncbi:hypothetical protein ACH5RR_018436 [Cinchona calisaya]|uniref:Uncharacterized protein n=1 Tax=Cinchona calisaya TaxID=153742 RepID=A0ABD2ZLH1_9GENT
MEPKVLMDNAVVKQFLRTYTDKPPIPQAPGFPGKFDLVYEFLGNTYELQSNTVWVRQRPVSITSIDINKIFGTPNIPFSEFTKFIPGDIDFKEVINVLTNSKGTWSKCMYGGCKWFMTQFLTLKATVWNHFICMNLMPVSHPRMRLDILAWRLNLEKPFDMSRRPVEPEAPLHHFAPESSENEKDEEAGSPGAA